MQSDKHTHTHTHTERERERGREGERERDFPSSRNRAMEESDLKEAVDGLIIP
jgi:hypothetical protein